MSSSGDNGPGWLVGTQRNESLQAFWEVSARHDPLYVSAKNNHEQNARAMRKIIVRGLFLTRDFVRAKNRKPGIPLLQDYILLYVHNVQYACSIASHCDA